MTGIRLLYGRWYDLDFSVHFQGPITVKELITAAYRQHDIPTGVFNPKGEIIHFIGENTTPATLETVVQPPLDFIFKFEPGEELCADCFQDTLTRYDCSVRQFSSFTGASMEDFQAGTVYYGGRPCFSEPRSGRICQACRTRRLAQTTLVKSGLILEMGTTSLTYECYLRPGITVQEQLALWYDQHDLPTGILNPEKVVLTTGKLSREVQLSKRITRGSRLLTVTAGPELCVNCIRPKLSPTDCSVPQLVAHGHRNVKYAIRANQNTVRSGRICLECMSHVCGGSSKWTANIMFGAPITGEEQRHYLDNLIVHDKGPDYKIS